MYLIHPNEYPAEKNIFQYLYCTNIRNEFIDIINVFDMLQHIKIFLNQRKNTSNQL